LLSSGPRTDKTTVIGLHLIVPIVNESKQEMACFKPINWTTLSKEIDWAALELELKDEKHRTGLYRCPACGLHSNRRTALIYLIMIAINKVAVLHRSLHAID
jgi:hypothetical protein